MKQARTLIVPALAAALFAASSYSVAQTGATTPSGSGSATSNQEVRRGVPGVDVDVGTRDRGRQSGVPGVDVDVRNTRTNAGDADMRRSGDRTASAGRRARADRN